MRQTTKWTQEDLVKAVAENYSISGVLRQLGLVPAGANYKVINRHIQEANLDTSHFRGQGWSKGMKRPGRGFQPIYTLEEILTKDSSYKGASSTLKKRLLNEKVLNPICTICQITEWLGQPLVLHLDHINGDHNDHRLENLRLLCPNCHSQTETYCRTKSQVSETNRSESSEIIASFPLKQSPPKPPKPPTLCPQCQKPCSGKGRRCEKCYRQSLEKVGWPEPERLQTMVKDSSYIQVGKKLGVSDNAVRKRLRNHPPTPIK